MKIKEEKEYPQKKIPIRELKIILIIIILK
jgi:hypothetical protein